MNHKEQTFMEFETMVRSALRAGWDADELGDAIAVLADDEVDPPTMGETANVPWDVFRANFCGKPDATIKDFRAAVRQLMIEAAIERLILRIYGALNAALATDKSMEPECTVCGYNREEHAKHIGSSCSQFRVTASE